MVVHHLAVGEMHQPPGDGGERRRLRVRLGIVGHPCSALVAADGPAPGNGFPEVLVAVEPLQPLPEPGVDLIHLGEQQTDPRH
jgi:hypothetical protein